MKLATPESDALVERMAQHTREVEAGLIPADSPPGFIRSDWKLDERGFPGWFGPDWKPTERAIKAFQGGPGPRTLEGKRRWHHA